MVQRPWIGLGTLTALAASIVSVSASTDLQIVDSAALGVRRDLPWSELVQIDDPFEGQFIGVFDRNYFFDQFLNARARIEVQSLWRPESIRVLLIARDRDCTGNAIGNSTLSDLSCSAIISSRKVTELFVRVDEQVFQISGENNLFQVNAELAQALQSAPSETVTIRLVTEYGEAIDSEIGPETVEAWAAVYAEIP
ncbi:MAG: hypothetical protein AAF609_25720 [Cyanobacteria bacterium P01_C01_bin.120]